MAPSAARAARAKCKYVCERCIVDWGAYYSFCNALCMRKRPSSPAGLRVRVAPRATFVRARHPNNTRDIVHNIAFHNRDVRRCFTAVLRHACVPARVSVCRCADVCSRFACARGRIEGRARPLPSSAVGLLENKWVCHEVRACPPLRTLGPMFPVKQPPARPPQTFGTQQNFAAALLPTNDQRRKRASADPTPSQRVPTQRLRIAVAIHHSERAELAAAYACPCQYGRLPQRTRHPRGGGGGGGGCHWGNPRDPGPQAPGRPENCPRGGGGGHNRSGSPSGADQP